MLNEEEKNMNGDCMVPRWCHAGLTHSHMMKCLLHLMETVCWWETSRPVHVNDMSSSVTGASMHARLSGSAARLWCDVSVAHCVTLFKPSWSGVWSNVCQGRLSSLTHILTLVCDFCDEQNGCYMTNGGEKKKPRNKSFWMVNLLKLWVTDT